MAQPLRENKRAGGFFAFIAAGMGRFPEGTAGVLACFTAGAAHGFDLERMEGSIVKLADYSRNLHVSK